ncbi:MAG: hypothetical protein ACTSWW_06640 [Promethearchaeota archaeon]
MTQEERLFHRYTEKLEDLSKSFNRDPVAPFIGINLREGPAPVFGDWFSTWQSDTIHLYSDQAPLFEELLGFSALASYISLPYRRSLYFLHVVFLLRFQTSTNPTFKIICGKIYEGVANDQEKAKADYLLYYRQIIYFLTEEKFLLNYLPVLPISLTFYEFYRSFYPIWYDLLGKESQFEVITQLFSVSESNLSLFFSQKSKIKQEWRKLYQKYLGESILLMQYDKLGLSTYSGSLILNPLLRDPAKIVDECLAKIPFFRGFHGTNLEYCFTIIIPETVKSKVIAYLHELYSSNFIIHFEIRKYVSYKTVLQFNSRVSKTKLIRNLFPFNSTEWKFSRARKTSMQQHRLTVFAFDFKPQLNEKHVRKFRLTPLHLYLAFNRNKLFSSIFHYETPSSLLQFVQQNIMSFNQLFDLKVTPRELKELADFSKSDEFLLTKSSRSNYSDEKLATLNKIASVLQYNQIINGNYPSWKKMWKEYLFFQESFRKKQKFSKIAIQKAIIQLTDSQIIIENRQMQFLEIVRKSWGSILTVVESSHRINILEVSLMIYTIEILQTDAGNSIYRYQIVVPAKYWISFSRLLIDIQDCHFYCLFQVANYENDEDLVLYYDYPTQSWNEKKFDLKLLNPNFTHLQSKYQPTSHLYVPAVNFPQESPQMRDASELIHNFSQMIATTQRWTHIANRLVKSRDDYVKFLKIWISKKLVSEKNTKKYLKDNFSLDYNQISQIIQNINFQAVPLPQYRDVQKVMIILQKYSFPCHPEVLLADPLLSGLFCHGLISVSVSGGGSNGLLLLEYELPTTILENPKSQMNQLIAKINQFFHLGIRLLVINHEYRFYSEQLLHQQSMKMDGFSHLKVSTNKVTLLNPHHIHYNFVEKKISSNQSPPVYCDPVWKWAFWQMIGYPVEIAIILKFSQSIQMSVISLLMKLPIGTIFVHDRERTESDVLIIAKLRCVKNVVMVFFFLSICFKKLKIHSHISFLTDYAINHHDLVSQLISQSHLLNFLRTDTGDFLEIPLVKNNKNFSLQERIWLYSRLEIEAINGKWNLTSQTWRSFIDALSKIDNICLADTEIEYLIKRLFRS